MSKKLSGKVALVTGGSRGIGAAAAKALADEGADVAITYVSSPEKAENVVRELTANGVRAAAIKADQGDAVAADKVVGSVVEQFGRLDILVNNAAVFAVQPSDDPGADTAALDRLNAVNYTGVVSTIRAATKALPDGGRIITIGSVVASRAGFQGVADYAATKAALVGYSKGAARDLGPRKITVNVVQPGPIDTDMNPADGEYSDLMKSTNALGRYGTATEVAAGIAFLASPEASYITGAVLDIDGGYGA